MATKKRVGFYIITEHAGEKYEIICEFEANGNINIKMSSGKPLTLATSYLASPFTGSDFQPYITAINLYQNGDYDTPVIQASLPRPVKKSDKINTRFKIKLDI